MDYQRLTIYIIPYNILYIIPFSVDYIIICGYLLGYCTTYIPLFFPNCISRAHCLEQSGGVGWFETSQLLLSYPPVLKHGGKAHRILMPKCHGQRHILSSNTKDVWCLHMTRSAWWFQSFGLFSISYMGCHPPTIDEFIFFRGVGIPPTRYIDHTCLRIISMSLISYDEYHTISTIK